MPLRPTALFHLGLFPIVLLLWAWADSVKMNSAWGRKFRDGGSFTIGVANSALRAGFIGRNPDSSSSPSRSYPLFGKVVRFELSRTTSYDGPPPLFPAPKWENGTRPAPYPAFHFRMLHLPLWLLLAAYLPLWLALSYWRSSRIMKRHLRSLPPAQPQSD